jgi:Mn-dependent DtxR family transcriptional regulator
MRINRSDTIAGQPILTIRKLLDEGSSVLWGLRLAENILGVKPRIARRILDKLEMEGYVVKAEPGPDGERWDNTAKGNALAMARLGKPIKRGGRAKSQRVPGKGGVSE